MAKTSGSSSPRAGINPVFVIIAIVLAVAAGGYVLLTRTPQGASLVKNTGIPGMAGGKFSEKDFSFVEDPLVRKHYAAQANQMGNYRVKSTSSGKGGYTIMEMEPLNDTEFAFRTVDHNGSKEMSDVITIGDTVYLKDYADGSWWKQTNKPEETSGPGVEGVEEYPGDPETVAEEYMEKEQVAYRKVGEEPCGKLTCHKYEEEIPQNPEGKRTLWFDTSEFLLRREEFGFGEFRSVNEYEYENVSVRAPSPTKDVPEGRSIYEYMQSDVTTMPGMSPESFDQSVPGSAQDAMDYYQDMMAEPSEENPEY